MTHQDLLNIIRATDLADDEDVTIRISLAAALHRQVQFPVEFQMRNGDGGHADARAVSRSDQFVVRVEGGDDGAAGGAEDQDSLIPFPVHRTVRPGLRSAWAIASSIVAAIMFADGTF
jgi:hypothetical protein